MREDLRPYRDELVISTKAGYDMWPGPYGDGGSRKYLLASLDQSLGADGPRLRRHLLLAPLSTRDTPLEETMGALDTRRPAGQGALRRHLVVLGRADARGARDPARARHAAADPPAVVLDRSTAGSSRTCSTTLGELGVGCIAFSPLAQGVLTDRYLDGIPEGSRASRNDSLAPDTLTDETLAKVRALNEIAAARGQSLAQMALAWTLRDPRITSTLVGASSVEQLEQNLGALDNLEFSADELAAIDGYAPESAVNLWAGRATASARQSTMEYRRLGSSDLDVSEIALGSWLTFGGGVERERAVACIDRAFELGINFIDTANVYGRGAAEELLGDVLAHPAARLVRARHQALLPDGRR